MTSHLPPSPLRVCWYAAFPLRWLGALPKPAYFVTRVFTASFYIYVDVYIHIYIYEYIRIYTDLNG